MLVSLLIQSLAISAGLVISIMTVDKLGAISLPQPMPPYPRIPKAVQIISSHRASTTQVGIASAVAARPFVAPARIPAGVATIHDGPEMMAQAPALAFGSGQAGVIGVPGVPGGTAAVTGDAPPPPPAPKKNATQEKVLRVGGHVLEARMVKRVLPVYPPLARQARIAGTVRLEGVISREGRVINLQVISGHPLLIRTAVDAVRQWIYRPTLLNHEPVEVIAPIEVNFVLGQ